MAYLLNKLLVKPSKLLKFVGSVFNFILNQKYLELTYPLLRKLKIKNKRCPEQNVSKTRLSTNILLVQKTFSQFL